MNLMSYCHIQKLANQGKGGLVTMDGSLIWKL